MEPNRENIKKWVDALLSDEYKQGGGALAQSVNDHIEYCCLGVACEVALANGIELIKAPVTNETHTIEYDAEGAVLPHKVQEWLGLSSDPIIEDTSFGHPISAINANDSRNWTFRQIAEAITAKYLEDTPSD